MTRTLCGHAGDRADFDAFDDAESIACPHPAKTLPAKPSVPVEDVRRLKEEGLTRPRSASSSRSVGRPSTARWPHSMTVRTKGERDIAICKAYEFGYLKALVHEV